MVHIELYSVDGKITCTDTHKQEYEIHLGDSVVLYLNGRQLANLINRMCKEFWDDNMTYEQMADLAEHRLDRINELEEEIRTLREEITDLRLGGELLV